MYFAPLKSNYFITELFGYQKTLKLGCAVDGLATFVLTIIFMSIQIFTNCKTYKNNNTVEIFYMAQMIVENSKIGEN